MVEVLALPHRVPSLGRAVEQFLAAKPLSANGRRSYAHTLGTVVGDLGADLALAGFTAERVRHVLEDRWGDASAATWNNRITALGSFRRWIYASGWTDPTPLAGIEPRDDTAALRYDALHALWTRPGVHVREKALWRMLYDTAAPALSDLCPDTGRGRLSYQRAWTLFEKASGSGWTLHDRRHTARTPLAEEGVSAPMLKAKSRHQTLRSLDRYVRPGLKAVAALTAQHDPGRRHPQ